MNDNLLVTVCVLTYNSSCYVLDTLNSIKEQTYKNIEIIICDDASSDTTLDVCEKWIREHGKRFVNTQIITVAQNTGIPANCNRGLEKSAGEWIKYIAGDDCLYPNAIYEYINCVESNPSELAFYANTSVYDGDFKEENFSRIENIYPKAFKSKRSTAWMQYNLLSLGCIIYAPTVFLNKKLLLHLGGFDESIKLCEDWPMWLNITYHGYRLHYMDVTTTKYRVHEKSVFGEASVGLLFSRFYAVEKLIYDRYIRNKALLIIQFVFLYHYYLRIILDRIGMNKKKWFCRVIYTILIFPLAFIEKIIFKLCAFKQSYLCPRI